MRIGFVLDDTLDTPDGVQQYVLMVGAWLTQHGHEVHYLVTNTVRTDIPNVHSLGKYMKGRFNGNHVRTPLPVSKGRIKLLLDELKLDIIHLQMPYSPFFGGRVVMAAGKTPVIATFNILPYTNWQRRSNHSLGRAQRRSTKRLARVIAPSPMAATFAQRAYRVDPVVLPYPIDLARYREGRPLEEYSDKLNILFLGRLVARKGVLALLHAYQALDADTRSRCRLIIAGRGPQLDEATRLAGNANDIVFTGFVSEEAKPDYLASADIAVFPAFGGESFGIVLTEAMASGSGVVIGGNNPGYTSVLAPMPECLFDPTDIPALTRTLAKLISDDPWRRQLHAQQQSYIETFDVNLYGQRLLALYRDAQTSR